MNKKGFLLGETVIKIVIAVICLAFLVYLLVSLYYNNGDDKNLKFAEESLQYISKADGAIEIYNPEDWWIISGGGMICICEKNDLENCVNGNKKGFCLESEKKVEGNKIKIEDVPMTLTVKDGEIKK